MASVWIACPCSRRLRPAGLLIVALLAGDAGAQTWSTTELHYQLGRALQPHPVIPSGAQHILTLQHASGWKYGENFFFADLLCCTQAADRDIYLEWYPYLDLGSLADLDLSWGPFQGIGPLGGVNWAAQAKVLKITPGFRFQLRLPGFAFANLDYLYLVDRSAGLAAGGAPIESGSHLVDFNWKLPFRIKGAKLSLEGHGEWRGPRTTELGTSAPHWILLQPQLRLDLGSLLGAQPGRLHAGIEFHVWKNKYGFADADEILPQLLVVWGF